MSNFARLFPLSVILVAAGCAASAGGSGGDDDDLLFTGTVLGDPSTPGDGPGLADNHDELCEDPERMVGAWCEFTEDCCEGQECVAGLCGPPRDGDPCEDHADCPAGDLCIDGLCDCVGEHCDDLDCPDEAPRLAGSWDFESRLNVSEAVDDWILWIGDAAAEGCDWVDEVAWLVDLPAWAPDLLCLVADITRFMNDMEVAHVTRFAAIDDVTYTATDRWTRVTFDPDGDAIEVDPARLECPIEVEDFEARWSCGETYLDAHEVHLPVNGLVKLALDVVACTAMEHAWGCSWDAAMDELCRGVDDPFLAGACEEIVESLVIPDPCFEVNDLTLSGVAESLGPDDLEGDWAGDLDGEDFTGTFTASR